MKNLIIAALTALSVGACATVENGTSASETKAETIVPQNISVEAGSDMTAKTHKSDKADHHAPDHHKMDHHKMDHHRRSALPDHSDETLLYGAMTKYELMGFVEIVQSGNQQAVLEQDDIITVFAPNNSAFDYAGRPEQDVIAEFLGDHMIAGRYDVQTLKNAIAETRGPVTLTTLSGKRIKIYHMDGKIKIADANGVLATITQSDMRHSNGVMHHISDVLHRQRPAK